MKITDLSILCKWENLKNRQCIKYLFAPLCVCVCVFVCVCVYVVQLSSAVLVIMLC